MGLNDQEHGALYDNSIKEFVDEKFDGSNTIDNQVLNLDPSITKYDVRLRWKYTF